MAAERGLGDVHVSSAGTGAWDGSPASDGSMLVAMEREMDLSGHQSRRLTRQMIADSDLILAMAPSHLSHIQEMGGKDAESKAFLLTEYASRGAVRNAIDDPFGSDLLSYR